MLRIPNAAERHRKGIGRHIRSEHIGAAVLEAAHGPLPSGENFLTDTVIAVWPVALVRFSFAL